MFVVASLFLAGLAFFILLLRRVGSSPLGLTAMYFTYFSYGPVFQHFLGGEIYRGTKINYIPQAMWGFALALAGWAAADVVWRFRNASRAQVLEAQGAREVFWSSWTYRLLMWGCSVYGFAVAGWILLRGGGGDKLEAIALAGPMHYSYLLVMSLGLCWTYSAWPAGKRERRVCFGAWGAFLVYCLLTAERDFLLIAFAIGVHAVFQQRDRRLLMRFVGIGFAALLAGTAIFVARAGERLSLGALLNQGSTLFIDTFIYDWVTSGSPYPSDSWVSAMIRSDATEFGNLSQWFVAIFTGNPNASSAYGFSLSAEAFMNAGFLGVFGIYFTLGVVQLMLLTRGLNSGLWKGVSVAFMYEMLYAIRGELTVLVSACLATGLLAVLFRMGQEGKPASGVSGARTQRDSPVE